MIEVLISVALYGIALVSLMGLLITSVTAGAIGESSAVAVNLARQRIEALTTLTMPALLAENGVVTTAQVPTGQGRPYTISVAITDQPAYADATVTVTWNVAGAQTYSRTLVTRVAK
jgi:type II secretory pathway pseudopilin PulG